MNRRVFMCRNTLPHETPLVLGTDSPEKYGLIATLEGSFDRNGRQTSAILTKKSMAANNPMFVSEVKELVHYLRTDYANGLLFSSAEMEKVCSACGEGFTLKEKNKKVYGFETHTDDHYYFIKCIPARENSSFRINCYDRRTLIEAGLEKDDGGI